MHILSFIIAVSIPVSITTGCSGGQALAIEDSLEAIQSSAALGSGDIIDIRVYQEDGLTGTFQVSTEGTIDYPLLATLRVEGMTPSAVAAVVRKGLADGYLRDPYVTVNIKELQSKRVYVLGQVSNPGTFKYEEGMTIIHVITLAGGFTKIARKNDVVVTRTRDSREVRTIVPVDDISEGKARNLMMLPGDIVFVPESIL